MYVNPILIKCLKKEKKPMRMASRGPYSERACETIQLSYFFIKLKKNPSR